MQDLAGNAMSITVIAASLTAALCAGAKHFDKTSNRKTPSDTQLTVEMLDQELRYSRLPNQKSVLTIFSELSLNTPGDVPDQMLAPSTWQDINLEEFMEDARLSAGLCECEGSQRISKAPIHECQTCGQTACSNCKGNPEHKYQLLVQSASRTYPTDFEHKWRSILPAQLQFQSFPDVHSFRYNIGPTPLPVQEDFVNVVEDANLKLQNFWFHKIKRQEKSWVIIYRSQRARLEIRVSSDIRWFVYLDCPPSEPGNSPLRKHLTQAIAPALSSSSFFDLEWKV